MKDNLTPEIFAEFIADFCIRSPLSSGRNLYWTIIANPAAGGFSIKSRREKIYGQLKACALLAGVNSRNPGAGPSKTGTRENSLGLILTRHKGHAETITADIIREAETASSGALYLIITAGGDGTSLEVLSTLFYASAEAKSHIAVLRLPMGTGNDGADAFELDEALRLLIEPSEIRFQKALRLVTSVPGKGPYLAFNILSVGLDAFVTHMTNKMKGKLPGDFYKLWVDIASLFYDRIYKVGMMNVNVFDESGNEIKKISEKILLLAMGESGHRYYGSHKNILPDDRNVCAVKQMSMLRNIALKDLFTTGGHAGKPESMLFSAGRAEITCEYPILAQMDGEAVLLETADFPAAIELTEPVIPILKLKK